MSSSTDGGLYDLFLVEGGNGEEEGEEWYWLMEIVYVWYVRFCFVGLCVCVAGCVVCVLCFEKVLSAFWGDAMECLPLQYVLLWFGSVCCLTFPKTQRTMPFLLWK